MNPTFLLLLGNTILGFSVFLIFGPIGLLIYLAGFSAGSVFQLVVRFILEHDERRNEAFEEDQP